MDQVYENAWSNSRAFNAKYKTKLIKNCAQAMINVAFGEYTSIDITIFNALCSEQVQRIESLISGEYCSQNNGYAEIANEMIWAWPVFEQRALELGGKSCIINPDNACELAYYQKDTEQVMVYAHQLLTKNCFALLTHSSSEINNRAKLALPESGDLLTAHNGRFLKSADDILMLVLTLYLPEFKNNYVQWCNDATLHQRVCFGQGEQPSCTILTGYRTPPIIVLNRRNDINDILTFAHEVGHFLHYTLAMEHQHFYAFEASLFVKESIAFMLESLVYLTLMQSDLPDKMTLKDAYKRQTEHYVYLAMQKEATGYGYSDYAKYYPLSRLMGEKLSCMIISQQLTAATLSEYFNMGAKLSTETLYTHIVNDLTHLS